jgi:CSLREA domain-containing protein
MKKLLTLILLSVILLSASPFQSVSAGTLTVNALDDTDDGHCDATHCSLREALHYAATGDTIDFSITGTIMLDGTQLTIDKSLEKTYLPSAPTPPVLVRRAGFLKSIQNPAAWMSTYQG